MGCVASKLEVEEEVVTILRERESYIKLAVERRYALAEAHSKYNKSLFAVSAAIKLFVARHSSPDPPFLITYCDPHEVSKEESQPQNPLLEHSRTHQDECHQSQSCMCSDSSSESEDERDELHDQMHQHQQEKHVNGYYYMQMPPPIPIQSGNGDFGWDFFNNPFEGNVRSEGISRKYVEEDLNAVREQEGIPELEQDDGGEFESEECEPVEEVQKGINAVDAPEIGRELLEALGDIEDYFLKAYYSGKEVSRMLEANRIHLHSNLEEIKGTLKPWHRSISSRPLSCKSLVSSSSKSSSAWTETTKSDPVDNYVGMDSESHSLTLERLYAWEKKLYEEVKAGDNTRKVYEKKCTMLKHHEIKGCNLLETEKMRTAVKDLHAQILVAIRSAESISRRIDKLRDKELQPQIHELLQGLMRSWKVLLVAHETQNRILSDVKSFTCPTYEKFCTDSQRLATLQLQIELHSWRTCFMNYISATKGYVEALYIWLSKFVATGVEVSTSKRRNSSIPVHITNGPPLLVTCHNWLESMKLLQDQSVSLAMKGFARDVRVLWVRQGEELQQKRKVDNVAKEYEKQLKLVQNPILAIKLTDDQYETDDDPAEKRNQLNALSKRLEFEKEKHQNCMQQTQYITLTGLQTGFGSVFESLIHYSEASLKMYSNIINLEESSKSNLTSST